MSDEVTAKVGTIGWVDLTVPDADGLERFYSAVVGWTPVPVEMGGYSDFCMSAPGSDLPVAGICHARGPNAELPPVWLLYLMVEDLVSSLAVCAELGGTVVLQPRSFGEQGRYCVIRDPAGAVVALFQKTG